MRYEAYLFIEGIKTKSWLEMLNAVDAALEAQRAATPLPLPEDDLRIVDFLGATRRYLLSPRGDRPEGIDNSMLLLLKPICQTLVARGHFAPQSLDVFSDLDAWHSSGPTASHGAPCPH